MKIEVNELKKKPTLVDIDEKKQVKAQEEEITKKFTGDRQIRMRNGHWEKVTLSFPRKWEIVRPLSEEEIQVMKALETISEVLSK